MSDICRGFENRDTSFSKRISSFSKRDSVFSKVNNISRKDTPYSKLTICSTWLIQEDNSYLLFEDGERIKL